MRGNLASRERVLKYFIPQSILYILFFSIIETKGGFYIYETAKYHIMHSPAYFFFIKLKCIFVCFFFRKNTVLTAKVVIPTLIAS